MKKRFVATFLAAFMVLAVTVGGFGSASAATKQINANYENVKIFVNGSMVTVQPNEEPFIYNGRTFVPVRVISEALKLNVDWIGATKYVKITGGGDTSTLAQKDKEIADLKAQLTQKNTEIQNLKNKIADLEENESDGSLNDLEDDLVSSYDQLEDVEIEDIRLDGDEDDVNVEIEVDLSDYEDEWADLTNRNIEDWLEDMVRDIQDEFSEDTNVEGTIIDIDSDDELVEFSKDGEDDLDVYYSDDDYRDLGSDAEDVEDSLDGEIYNVGGIRFAIADIDYDEDDDSVDVTLDADDNNAASDWGDLNNSTIENDVVDICQDIVDIFKDEGGITLDTINIEFNDEDGDWLDSYEYDVDNDELY